MIPCRRCITSSCRLPGGRSPSAAAAASTTPSWSATAEASPDQPAFVFDTRVSGNLNIGHEYGTDLAEGDRMDLLEYLKTK